MPVMMYPVCEYRTISIRSELLPREAIVRIEVIATRQLPEGLILRFLD